MMIYLQVLKDVDDIDHLTVEKIEDDAHVNIDHFSVKRIADEKFSLANGVKLLKHMEAWYPQTAETVNATDLKNPDSVYNALRSVRDIIINLI